MAILFQLSTLFLFTIRIGDLLGCLTLCYFLIFVLNPLLSKSNTGEPELFAGILRLFQEIWDILLLQILVIKFSVARSYTLFQPWLVLKILSFLKIIVRIFHDDWLTRIFYKLCSFCTKSNKHASTRYKAACQKSSQPKKGFWGIFGIKVNLTIHYSLFTIHYSSTGLLFMVTIQDSFFAYLRRQGPHL